MSTQKIFAGARIRRIRIAKGLTQTLMAEGLGISPSYLNLIERNQRPLTVQLILKLASVYKVDPEELYGEGTASLASLREVFADPLLCGELPGEHELVELAEAAPNAASALVKLYRAYREQAERLTDLSDVMAAGGGKITAPRLPANEVRDVLESRAFHFASLEEEADAFHKVLNAGDDLAAALKSWLQQEHGITVRVLPVSVMPSWRRRYDRHSQRLFLSERLSPPDQLRELAIEASLIRMRAAIAAEIDALKLSSDEARRLVRFELARYAAHALMMPHTAFLDAAERQRYDIDILAARFRVSFEQAATRLTTLAREEGSGIPFFLLEVDNAGNRIRRMGAEGFPHARFGGACPKLASGFRAGGKGRELRACTTEAVEMPDGEKFLTISRTVDGPHTGFDARPRRTAILLGCDLSFVGQTVYGSALSRASLETPLPIGRACRLCERQGCLSRAEPPVTRPLGLDEMVTGFSAFDFQ